MLLSLCRCSIHFFSAFAVKSVQAPASDALKNPIFLNEFSGIKVSLVLFENNGFLHLVPPHLRLSYQPLGKPGISTRTILETMRNLVKHFMR
jgi:hypothetical protein